MSFETSPTTAKLDEAIAKAQGLIQNASKDKANPHFKSKYADLASVWEACREALSANKIAVTQWVAHSDDNRVHMVTRMACSGEWMNCRSSIPVTKHDAQGYGSAITYLRRYSLAAAVGVAPDEDDGEAAIGRSHEPQKQQQSPSIPADALMSIAQMDEMLDAFGGIGVTPDGLVRARNGKPLNTWNQMDFQWSRQHYNSLSNPRSGPAPKNSTGPIS